VKAHRLLPGLLCVGLFAGCVGTTGYNVIDFRAAAAGPADAVAGKPYTFTTPVEDGQPDNGGWKVTLTQATLQIGALYLNEARSTSGAQPLACVQPGTYVAQVTTGLKVNLLSAKPQYFPVRGAGTTLPVRAGEVWLMGPGLQGQDINTTTDNTPILVLKGTASKPAKGTESAQVIPFAGQLYISQNLGNCTSACCGPVGSTLCQKRIVSNIPSDLSPDQHGDLLLRIDPKRLFTNIDFATLQKFTAGYGFDSNNPSGTQADCNIFENLLSTGPYHFEWVEH
jgi:hypothetical protein